MYGRAKKGNSLGRDLCAFALPGPGTARTRHLTPLGEAELVVAGCPHRSAANETDVLSLAEVALQ